ncbi:hypothetical protein CK203_058633 [Vitis vinifera]|uniref:Uncharacterized protein n=1 Tax=Vitis vinifera TaxID=29760 RepID=A0A438FTJ9_VITVI|nr:hypothetical protein CK203_058633 [Vitis vinifera]
MTPFILFPERYGLTHRDVQIVTRSRRVAQPLPVGRLVVGITTRKELQIEDDEIFHQLLLELMMGLKGVLWAGTIPSSLHQKISHSDDELHLTGFTFDEVQVVNLEDDSRDMVPMSFHQYSSTLVLSMMRGMSYLPGLGLGHRQEGPDSFPIGVSADSCPLNGPW